MEDDQSLGSNSSSPLRGDKDSTTDPQQISIDSNKRKINETARSTEPIDVKRIKENYRLLATDRTIIVDAAPAAVTITLPKVATMANRTLEFKKIDSTANAMKVEPNFPETIDGAASVSKTSQYDCLRIKADKKSNVWWVV